MYRIRDLREDHDLTQAQIAKILKTTQQQYSKIETGRADISGEKLILLAQFYNVYCDYILGLVKEPRPLRYFAAAPRSAPSYTEPTPDSPPAAARGGLSFPANCKSFVNNTAVPLGNATKYIPFLDPISENMIK